MPDPATSDRRELSLSDALAVERTGLASERTLLAYVRTGLGLAGAGVSLASFFPMWPSGAGGVLLSVLGAVALARGAVRFMQVRRDLRRLRRTAERRISGAARSAR